MKSQKNICFSQEQNKSMEVIDVLAFYTRLYVYFTYTVRTSICVFGLHFLHMPFSRLHVQQYEQAIIHGQPAYTL